MHRLSIQIRPDQHERLKALARPGMSIAALVRQALDEYLSKTLPRSDSDVH